MPRVGCVTCGDVWSAILQPMCPRCLGTAWLRNPDFIRPKHDPRVLPSGSATYRSVVTDEFLHRKEDAVAFMTVSGTWFHSVKHDAPCHFTQQPLALIPGSGICAGHPMPDHALDGLVVADAVSAPHVYAVDIVRFQADINAGEYVPVIACLQADCFRLRLPEHDHCAVHAVPPSAEPAE